jgi:peptidyl-prolyl cis-trans isomerase C
MYFNIGSKFVGTNLSAAILGSMAMFVAATSSGATIATVNGQNIDSTVFDVYLITRLQKPAFEATGEERDLILDELTDIYLLTSQPRARELEKTAPTSAQIELQSRGVLAQAVATDFMSKNQATDAEILEEYNEQIKLSPPNQYHARHILVESQGEATGLISQLDGGADFAELAIANSTGPSAPSGGDLGWFAPNQMVKPFSDAVEVLEDGAYTESPVQTEFGWHVIKREESRANEPPTLESVKDAIKQNIEQTKFQTYLEGLRAADAGTE